MNARIPPSLSAIPVVALLALAAACSTDTDTGSPSIDAGSTTTADAGPTTTVDAGPTTTVDAGPTTTAGTESGEAATTTTPAATEPADPGADILEPRLGTWVVGDAGEVDIDLGPDGLVLLDVRSTPGWQVSIDEQSPDEIEVDFEQANVEWEIEIQWENGILEIEIDQDIDPAEPGVVPVGVAGSVEFDVDSSGLVLVAAEPSGEWDVAVLTESSEEIEVLFVNGLAEYEVEIELDDGEIEIEVDFEVEGPFTP